MPSGLKSLDVNIYVGKWTRYFAYSLWVSKIFIWIGRFLLGVYQF